MIPPLSSFTKTRCGLQVDACFRVGFVCNSCSNPIVHQFHGVFSSLRKKGTGLQLMQQSRPCANLCCSIPTGCACRSSWPHSMRSPPKSNSISWWLRLRPMPMALQTSSLQLPKFRIQIGAIFKSICMCVQVQLTSSPKRAVTQLMNDKRLCSAQQNKVLPVHRASESTLHVSAGEVDLMA